MCSTTLSGTIGATGRWFGMRGARLTTPESVCLKCPPDVVVVIGESLRSDHVPMNGYHRNTMPRLSRDSTLISFAHVFSEPWCTHTSVPRIMTRADSANPDIAYKEQSFITLFKRAGYHTVWLSNQDSNSTYAYFMHEADSLVMGNPAKSMYNFDKWLDVELVPDIQIGRAHV